MNDVCLEGWIRLSDVLVTATSQQCVVICPAQHRTVSGQVTAELSVHRSMGHCVFKKINK